MRLERSRIEEVASGRARSLEPIDRTDGLLHTEGMGGGFDPSGLRDSAGRLWFSTIEGIAVIDPAVFRINDVVPPVLIEETRLAGGSAAPRSDGAIEVPAGTASIELAYTAFSFIAPAKVRFRYRLEGSTKRGRTSGHDAPPTTAAWRLGITRSKSSPQTTTACGAQRPRAGGSLCCPFCGNAPDSRSRLSRCSSRRPASAPIGGRSAARAAGSRSSSASRRSIGNDRASRGICTTIESFAEYAAEFTEEQHTLAGLRYRLQIQPELDGREFSADARRHLFLAYKEALHNIVKHAGATDVRVALRMDGPTLVLEVSDNGLGDGDTANDIQGWTFGTADTSGMFRAERSGEDNARIYTLTYQGLDVAGNVGTCTTTISVVHDQGKK